MPSERRGPRDWPRPSGRTAYCGPTPSPRSAAAPAGISSRECRFAAQHPERVDRLALLNTAPGRTGMLTIHRDSDGSLRRLKRLADVFERVIATWGSDPQYMVD